MSKILRGCLPPIRIIYPSGISYPDKNLHPGSQISFFFRDIKKERILSCILEFQIEEAEFLTIIEALKNISRHIDTVFCVGCISRCMPDGTVPVKAVLDAAGVFYRPNGKVNLGLGRPLAEEI